MIQEMQKRGYVVSPNNIFGLPGVLMYANGQGLWTVPDFMEIQVLNDRIRVFKTQRFGECYTRKTYLDTITVAVFDRVEDFFSWCETHGKRSEPALPAFAQGMD